MCVCVCVCVCVCMCVCVCGACEITRVKRLSCPVMGHEKENQRGGFWGKATFNRQSKTLMVSLFHGMRIE